jgi:DHA1 family tetracycline resistance protein-like MFS transporter
VNAAALAWAALSPNGWWFVASMPIAALGLVIGPALQSLLTTSVGADEQGRVQGAVQALKGLSAVIGPPVYGVIFAWSLRQTTGVDLAGAAVLAGSAFMALAFVLALKVGKRRPLESEAAAAE